MADAPLPYIHDGGLTVPLHSRVWLLGTNPGGGTYPGYVTRFDADNHATLGDYAPGTWGLQGSGASPGGLTRGVATPDGVVWLVAADPASYLIRVNNDLSSAGSNVTSGTLLHPRGITCDGTYIWVSDYGTGASTSGGVYSQGTGAHLEQFDTSGTFIAQYGSGSSFGGNIWEASNVVYANGNLFVTNNNASSSVANVGSITKWDASTGAFITTIASSSNYMYCNICTVLNGATWELWAYTGNVGATTIQRFNCATNAALTNITLDATARVNNGAMVTLRSGVSEVWMTGQIHSIFNLYLRFAVDGTYLGYYDRGYTYNDAGIVFV